MFDREVSTSNVESIAVVSQEETSAPAATEFNEPNFEFLEEKSMVLSFSQNIMYL